MIRRPPRSTQSRSSAASDVYKRQMHETAIAMPDYPAGVRPLRIALLTDTHMAGPDQSPERLARIVAAVDAQHPDFILLGGDYMGEPKIVGRAYGPDEAVAPLAQL